MTRPAFGGTYDGYYHLPKIPSVYGNSIRPGVLKKAPLTRQKQMQ